MYVYMYSYEAGEDDAGGGVGVGGLGGFAARQAGLSLTLGVVGGLVGGWEQRRGHVATRTRGHVATRTRVGWLEVRCRGGELMRGLNGIFLKLEMHFGGFLDEWRACEEAEI